MTELLQKAIAEIARLPADRQDLIAVRFLSELNQEPTQQDGTEEEMDVAYDVLTAAQQDNIAATQWDSLASLAKQNTTTDESLAEANGMLDDISPTDDQIQSSSKVVVNDSFDGLAQFKARSYRRLEDPFGRTPEKLTATEQSFPVVGS